MADLHPSAGELARREKCGQIRCNVKPAHAMLLQQGGHCAADVYLIQVVG